MLRWVTCAELPEPDHDEALVFARCQERGIPIQLLRWDDPNDLPSSGDTLIIRSTWNYHLDIEAFRDWIKRTSEVTTLVNPATVVLPNLNKRYLLESRVPIVPTTICSHENDVVFPTGKFVLKPTVGGGSYRTRVFDSASAEAEDFARLILQDAELMIQPFMDSVATTGEQSFVFLDGEFTHKVIKKPRLEADEEAVSNGLRLDAKDLAFAERAIDSIREEIVYARVDVMEYEGEWVLSELELTEPSLFLKQHPPAMERLLNWFQSAHPL